MKLNYTLLFAILAIAAGVTAAVAQSSTHYTWLVSLAYALALAAYSHYVRDKENT